MSVVRMLTVALALTATTALAADLKSGPQVGDKLAPFTVEKVAGAPNDNVPSGEQLCYRCKLGDRPVVMVFTRKVDANVVKLASELDAVVGKNADKKMGSFVNVIGDETKKTLSSEAKKLDAEAKLKNVAVVVPESNQNGPESYAISPKAEVTVLVYRDGVVKVNRAFAPGELNGEMVKKIIGDTATILN